MVKHFYFETFDIFLKVYYMYTHDKMLVIHIQIDIWLRYSMFYHIDRYRYIDIFDFLFIYLYFFVHMDSW